MMLKAYLYLWIMTVFMTRFETLLVLLILNNAGSRRCSLIMIKLSRTVPHALAYKQLTKLRQVHEMFAVVIRSAFEWNRIADVSLESF